MFEAIFWCCALTVAHTYAGYPILLFLASALTGLRADVALLAGETTARKRGAGRGATTEASSAHEASTSAEAALPRVSVLVAAWNEAATIRAKLDDCLALDYPADRIEVWVGSDGSDDGTDAIVAAERDPRVHLSSAPARAGKASVLNRLLPLSRGEVLVFTDANTRLRPDAVRRLVARLDDPAVGCVCGNLRLYNPRRSGYEESGYWRFESLLKLLESRRGAVIGANGGLYAIRRELFEPLPPDTIVDDLVIALRCLQAGRAVLFEPSAVAVEETTEDYARERGRKSRIGAGDFQALARHGALLHPRYGFAAFAFLSHKVLRWLAPLLLLGLLGSSVALAGRPVYRAALGLQLVGLGLALAGRFARLPGRLGVAASAARYFVEMNAGLVVGLGRWLRGTQQAAWQRTDRAPAAAGSSGGAGRRATG